MLFVCGCTDKEEVFQAVQPEELDKPCIITVDLNKQGDSRLALDYVENVGMKSTWEEGDGFTIWNIYDESDNITYYNFKLISGAGTSVGEFYCETTPPVEDYNYSVRYPNVDDYDKISLLNQKQVGDGNTDHLSDLVMMRHLVGHYTDIRFNSSDYTTAFNGGRKINTIGANFYKNTILKIVASNLPEDFLPVKLELEVSNSGYYTFWETNTKPFEDVKMSMTLEDFDKDRDFVAYMSYAVQYLFLPEGCTLRLTVTDENGESYYSNKYYTTNREISPGKLYKLTYNSGWTKGTNTNYQSSDFSADGTVHELSPIKEGNINVVFMGDGFSDRQIADGTYREVMEQGMAAFLSEEPFASFADCFNVYYVDAVSAYEGCIQPDNTGRTKFETYFGGGTHVGGNDNLAKEYTLKVDGLTADNIDNYLTIVMMNSSAYAGTCWMYSPFNSYDYDGQGYAVAYFPIGTSFEALRQVLTHEANGHGFGKLADEYDGNTYDASALTKYNQWHGWGFYSNVDYHSDVTQTLWSEFYVEPYITNEGIGAYEGAYTYDTGFYRPTQNSIMRYNVGGFNAPSRQIIYTRINKLLNPSWEYNHDEFLTWDVKNIPPSPVELTSETESRGADTFGKPIKVPFKPLAPPVVIESQWVN